MHYVYALQSTVNPQWLYIGYSNDLRTRVERHNGGFVKSTKAYRPLRLVYYEAYAAEIDARRRELEIKGSSQQKEILKHRIAESLKASS